MRQLLSSKSCRTDIAPLNRKNLHFCTINNEPRRSLLTLMAEISIMPIGCHVFSRPCNVESLFPERRLLFMQF